MAVITVTATPEPESHPPRVRVDVVDVGDSPAISQVTVVRMQDGVATPVRSNDGAPLELTAEGLNRAGTIFDPEAPFGVPVTYSTLQQPDSVSAQVVSESAVPWLIHPGLPNLSQPVEFRIGSFAEEVRQVRSGVFYPLGRSSAVVVTDGRRKAAAGSFTVVTETPGQRRALLSLLDDAGVLLLNVPPLMGLEVDTNYVAVLDVTERRVSDIGEDPLRDFVMPYVVVRMPGGSTPTSWTWADVVTRYPTWTDLIADNRTWSDLMDPTV